MGKGNKFEIADPTKQVEDYLKEASSKYKVGATGFEFHQILKLKPVFAFDYISLEAGTKCFDNPSLKISDFIGLLYGLKKVSEHTYESLHKIRAFRFHKIDFDDKKVTISRRDFKEKLTFRLDEFRDEELPNLWQFDLQYIAKARVAGFLYKGVFYLVWYDRDHLIYPRE